MASFSAQEKSTIRMDNALVVFLVISQVKAVPPRLHGTNASAKPDALPSTEDFNFSDSSIMVTIRSNLVEPAAFLIRMVIEPSSIAVPAYA